MLIKGSLIDLKLRRPCWGEVVMKDFETVFVECAQFEGRIPSVQQTLNIEMVNALGKKKNPHNDFLPLFAQAHHIWRVCFREDGDPDLT